MPKTDSRRARRAARHLGIRRKVKGTPQRPRLVVFRSLNHIYAQVIDDTRGMTVATASSLDSEVRNGGEARRKHEFSKKVGTLVAQRAVKKGITAVVFDRGGYKYHGRLKALAEAARQEGLKF